MTTDTSLGLTPNKFQAKRTIKTRLAGWRYGTFCKTQYASEPDCGGVPNFIRCHLSVIHLLDRIGQLPTMKVNMTTKASTAGPTTRMTRGQRSASTPGTMANTT